jgi:hypothetical protein
VSSGLPGGSTNVDANLGNDVDVNGVPLVANGGQGVGSSQDNSLQQQDCFDCFINDPGVVTGVCTNTDDLIFTLTLSGNDVGTTYTISGGGSGIGTYGVATIFTISGGADGTDKNITITDDSDNTCTSDLVIAGVEPCTSSFTCSLEPAILGQNCCAPCDDGNIVANSTYWTGYEHNMPLSNIAFSKPTRSSGDAFATCSNSYFAVDGDTAGNLSQNCLSVSETMLNPWWEVDLVGNFDIQDLHIYNRTDCCTSENQEYRIFVSETPIATFVYNELMADSNVDKYTHNTLGGGDFSIPINTQGRFVRIYLVGLGQLQLAEVQMSGVEVANTFPYTFQWSDGSIGNVANPSCLPTGNYCVTITDTALGCVMEECFNVQ